MNSLSDHDLDALSIAALVARMDEFLHVQHIERYGMPPFDQFKQCVSDIANTKLIAEQPEKARRKIAYLTFSYLVQMQLCSVSSGIENKVLYDENYSEAKWQSPSFRLRHGALFQYQAIGSRIAFEVFIDLLYVIENGKRIESKKSKLKAFRSWLCDTQNRFHYFAHVLLSAYHFDREIRTPEVHGGSRLTRRMLCLDVPDHTEQNEPMRLTNTLINAWRPLIDILNGIRPMYMTVSQASDKEWFNTFVSGDEDAIEARLAEMFDGVQ